MIRIAESSLADYFQSIGAVALSPISESIFSFFFFIFCSIFSIHHREVTVSVIAEAIWFKVGAPLSECSLVA